MRKWKHYTAISFVLILSLLFLGCGALYTGIKTPTPNLTVPLTAASDVKVGKAECTSYVWLVGTGDCSVSAAMKNGGITKVHHVDTEILSVFMGIFERYTLVVYGE